MSPAQQIRHATLATALRRFACEPSVQEHPHVLLYLQNLTERVIDLESQLDGPVDMIRVLAKRVNQLSRELADLQRRKEGAAC